MFLCEPRWTPTHADMPRPSLFSPPSSTLSLLPSDRFPQWMPASPRFPIGTPPPSHHRRRPPPAPLRSPGRGLPLSPSSPVALPLLSGSSSGIPSAISEPVAASMEEQHGPEQATGFVAVGYVSSVHGIKGELRVKPTTDFPELRFSKPGRRWLKTRIMGKESISEVELIGGRGHHGQKGWIISFSGIDTVEKAKQIVGSTLLVREGDRPTLEEGEFYTADLVGMRVVLKETGRIVGTIVNVINTGASDLLQVMLNSTVESHDHSSSYRPEIGASDSLVWIPFVEAIVPDVDMEEREMRITPPKGLLELNLRSDVRSKKERRSMEWKERKKLQQRLIAAKKKMCEVGQKHLLEGFSFGEKAQKSSLANQIVDINFKLFKLAVQSVNMPSGRYNVDEFINANSDVLLKNAFRVSHRCYMNCASERKNGIIYELLKEGHQLLMKSKAAIVIIINEESNRGCGSEPDDVSVRISESKVLQFRELFLACKRFLKMEEQGISIPMFLVSTPHEIRSYEELMSDNEYYNFDSQKVQFLEEEKLPIVSAFKDQSSNKILLKSPWDILQAPIGSGGVFSLLLSHKILDDLHEQGVEYVQVCSMSERSALGHPLFFGLVKSRGADMGIKIFEDDKGGDDDEVFDMIFSLRHLNKISKQMDKIRFHAVPEQHPHVKLVEKEWILVQPDAPNSFRLRRSIYSSLDTCSVGTTCVLQVSE